MNEVRPSHPSLQVSIGFILFGFVLAMPVAYFASRYLPSLQLLLGEFCIIIPTLLYINHKQYDFKEVFRLKRIDRLIVLISIGLGCSLTILMDELDRIISRFIKVPPEFEEVLSRILVADSVLETLILFFAAVVVAGIIEEMLFRGMLLKSLEARLEIPYAIFFSALIFAFFHLMPWLIQILLLGLVLGFLAWRCDSILPGAIIHAINNAFAFIYLNLEGKFEWYNWNGHVYPPILVIATAVAFYGLKWLYRLTENKQNKGPLPSSD
ncbi:CPBP family intramembrane metalloprotease [candidate division KSB1 bacterium]|nr:CPBP family intramembrane metalloprotease [candidate division KSB1 bacterium]NIT70248.1 CPBP family intramembrane metalloprotease [candidate division KSB1 bacterium]NIU23971.1 CPBP family intramembrane metalloprotease [candidate division KSB1 bacterium]NIU92571.1 CPBP family intramembrane metalloprotease [candidate division KSB1 bacterium]NIW68340.1 CPBP family intramembrane metalloprotease [candidate division KSB1 bacterium]